MEATLRDRVLLLLSIKREGKFISREHVMEKVLRDTGGDTRETEIDEVLEALTTEGLVTELGGGFAVTEEGKRVLNQRLSSGVTGLNLSYLRVLTARNYYPAASEALLPFLRDRATSVVKVFSHPGDPIGRLKPLFVRYARYKPKPVHIVINDEETLLSLVDAHAVDFIPYVHPLSSKEPDWFILDLDAGDVFKEHPRGFELLKIVTVVLVDVLGDYGIYPRVKFSGSRGMQIWSWLDNKKLPEADLFALYRGLAVHLQSRVEERLQDLPPKTLDLFHEIVPEGEPITTSVVAKKKERAHQVLVDWSSMKPMGDVRAPFSIHYKTGLVSCPVEIDKLTDFTSSMAEPVKVLECMDILVEAFIPVLSDPTELLRDYRRRG